MGRSEVIFFSSILILRWFLEGKDVKEGRLSWKEERLSFYVVAFWDCSRL